MAILNARRRLLSSAVLATTSALVLSSCGALGLGGDDEQAEGAPEAVLASFYPLQYAAQRVAGSDIEVADLVSLGGDAHDLELSVQQTADIADADLVVYLSGFQPAVDAAIEQSAPAHALDVTEFVDLQEATEADHDHAHDDEGHDDHAHDDEGHDDHAHEDEGHDDDHAHEDEGHDDDAHDDETHDGHDHGDHDPHFWLDPLRLADAGDAIAEQLAEQDADNADAYRENAAALRDDLEQLDADFTDTLASCERDLVVVNHNAFGYLTKYGLRFASIVGISPDAEPTAAGLAELEDLVAEEGVTTVFAERIASPRDAESLASDTGLEVEVLDPIEGLTDQTQDEDYLSLMQANLEALTRANGC